jgi:hypothetical protein
MNYFIVKLGVTHSFVLAGIIIYIIRDNIVLENFEKVVRNLKTAKYSAEKNGILQQSNLVKLTTIKKNFNDSKNDLYNVSSELTMINYTFSDLHDKLIFLRRKFVTGKGHIKIEMDKLYEQVFDKLLVIKDLERTLKKNFREFTNNISLQINTIMNETIIMEKKFTENIAYKMLENINQLSNSFDLHKEKEDEYKEFKSRLELVFCKGTYFNCTDEIKYLMKYFYIKEESSFDFEKLASQIFYLLRRELSFC